MKNIITNKDNIIKITLTILIGVGVLLLFRKYYKRMDIGKSMSSTLGLTEEFSSHNDSHLHDAPLEDTSAEISLDPDEDIVDGGILADDIEPFGDETRSNQLPKDCFPKDQLTPSELLPGNGNSQWSKVNPSAQGELGDQNFLDAGYHTGVNTVGQTLRNANYQIRSEPPNPQMKVSPWLQSTIEPDTNRKPLEIGGKKCAGN